MKKFNLMMSLLFVGAAFSPAFAQSGDKNLKTLLSPDKVWYNVISISNNYPDYVRSSDGGVSPFTFEGTEERNGHVYTRMVTEDNPDEAILLMREEDGKVYFTLPWDYSEEALYCDFNLEAGDAFESYFAHPDWDRPNVLIPSYVIIEKTGYIELNG